MNYGILKSLNLTTLTQLAKLSQGYSRQTKIWTCMQREQSKSMMKRAWGTTRLFRLLLEMLEVMKM